MTHSRAASETLERHRDEMVRVGASRSGKGLFAGRRYRADELIGVIWGEQIDDPDYASDYCFDLENGCQLEPLPPFRYLNHSCEPNCYFDLSDDSAGESLPTVRRIHLYAFIEIVSGDELTIDYNWGTDSNTVCHCQSPSCRWVFIGADYLAGTADN